MSPRELDAGLSAARQLLVDGPVRLLAWGAALIATHDPVAIETSDTTVDLGLFKSDSGLRAAVLAALRDAGVEVRTIGAPPAPEELVKRPRKARTAKRPRKIELTTGEVLD